MYIDTHVHLNDETIYQKINETLNEAQIAGVSKFFVVGYEKNTSKLAIEIAKQYGWFVVNSEDVAFTDKLDSQLSNKKHQLD